MTQVAVAKWGNSLALRLPKHVADDLGLTTGTAMAVDVEGGRLVAKPVGRRPRPKLADLVAAITPKNRHAAADWGAAVGNEVW